MARQYPKISLALKNFIMAQKLFFVATASADGRVNISPKGMDSLRVLENNRVLWLNVTGSGNETAAHVQDNPRMTLMFVALEGDPMILRLYGQAKAIHIKDPQWPDLLALFPSIPGARQIFDVSIDLVQTSCGMAVPFFDYVKEREQLSDWANQAGEDGLKTYWREKNTQSIDGKPTHIIAKNIK
ncbi:MAG: pyridoxamine 5'-phosphate oxidase family protein [Methylococcaceae bacterium]|jgi:hypothetical protein